MPRQARSPAFAILTVRCWSSVWHDRNETCRNCGAPRRREALAAELAEQVIILELPVIVRSVHACDARSKGPGPAAIATQREQAKAKCTQAIVDDACVVQSESWWRTSRLCFGVIAPVFHLM